MTLIVTAEQLELCLRILVAAVLSGVIGFQRERKGHAAGLRTHMLVGLGAAVFTVVSVVGFAGSDTARVAAQIVTGIGFLGAGAIFHRDAGGPVRGLTTAAGIWVVAALGMACGTGLYFLAFFTTLVILVVLVVVARIEQRFFRPRTPTN